jgi:hypothetical protein
MVPLTSLWLPIVASAVGVFLASFITHMVLPYHRSDVLKLSADKEDQILDALRRISVPPGDYAAPHAGSSAGMNDPAFIAKATKGPLAFMTIAPGAAPSMGPYLAAGSCTASSSASSSRTLPVSSLDRALTS